jgi:uncharacterized protein (DUF1697 family)
MIYVALLRGINVGGNNLVDMKKLKTTFESIGFRNVVTYINSGNIIFEELTKRLDIIVTAAETAIRRDLQLDVKVLVRDYDNIDTICRKLPPGWVKNDSMRTDVMFLWEKYDSPEVLEKLKISMVDNVRYMPGAVLWNVEGKDYSKSGMTKLVGTDLYRNMTIRNVNTVRKIHQIMSAADGRQSVT